MKRIVSIVILFLCIGTLNVELLAQLGEGSYPARYSDSELSATNADGQRYVRSAKLNSPAYGLNGYEYEENNNRVCRYKIGWDDNSIIAQAGETVTPIITYAYGDGNEASGRMHCYVYLDKGQDGQYDLGVSTDATVDDVLAKMAEGGSDLMAFTYYQGKNSNGETTGEDCQFGTLPSFTIPAGLPDGTYRMRYKVDRNCIDPFGSEKILTCNGCIIEMRLSIRDGQTHLSVVPSPHGEVLTPSGTSETSLPSAVPLAQPYTIRLVSEDGYLPNKITIRYGSQLDGAAINYGMKYWEEMEIPASALSDACDLVIWEDTMKSQVRITPEFTKVETPYPVRYETGNNTNPHERYISSVGLAGGVLPNTQISYGEDSDKLMYRSHLGWGEGFQAQAGDLVDPEIGFVGAWMQGYVYLDRGNDGNFDATMDGYNIAEGSDVMSVSYYGDNLSVAENGNKWNPEPFTIPADLEDGFYRMRFKVDWGNIHPFGSYSIKRDGGTVVDVRLHIHKEDNAVVEVSADLEHGEVCAGDNSALPAALPQSQAYTIKLNPEEGYKLSRLIIRSGYHFDREPYLYGMEQWREKILLAEELNADGTYEIPADMVMGRVHITPVFVKENVATTLETLDRTNWGLSASSWSNSGEEGTGDGHYNAIKDGNNNTYWHSNYTDGRESTNGVPKKMPQWFVIDLQQSETIAGFTLLPRQNNENGICLGYKMFVSDEPFPLETPASTEEKLTKVNELTGCVKEGTLARNLDLKEVRFSHPVKGRYVLFVYTDAVGDWAGKHACLAEFNLYTYTGGLSEIDAQEAQDLLDYEGVGYPLQPSRTTLQGVIDTATDNSDLLEAMRTYKATTDIQMPEDGKAYTFTSIQKDAAKKYYFDTENTGTAAEPVYKLVLTEKTTEALPMTAVFVCHQIGEGQYTFVNNAGQYLLFRHKDDANDAEKGYNDNRGLNAAYDKNAVMTISKMVTSTSAPSPDETYFGNVMMRGKRSRADDPYFVVHEDGKFDASTLQFYNDTYSSALLMEEVAYPNVASFSLSAVVAEIGSVATFSAPFPTTVPAGVTAYVAESVNAGEVQMTPIATEGETLPRNTGVVLAGEGLNAQMTMIPATDEGDPESIDNNLLAHSAGAEKTIVAEEGFTSYILAKVNDVVKFYKAKIGGGAKPLKVNRAYLRLPDAGGAQQAVRMVFRELTGIDDVTDAQPEQPDAPLYDLGGRRVTYATKGGVYIRNGKKFIF